MTLDWSGTFLITASTDKYISIFDMLNGNMVCKATCGETTTGLLLTLDCKFLISTSHDGCIYFWKLDASFTKNLH